MQNCGDAVGSAKVPTLDRAAQHVFDVVPGEVGGAQQTCEGAPFRVLFVPLPLTDRQQGLNDVLVASRRMAPPERYQHSVRTRGESS